MKQPQSIFFFRTLIMAAGLFVSSQTHAQQDSSAARKLTDKMKIELSLTDQQYNQVYNVNQHFITGVKSLQSEGGRKLAKFKKMKFIGDERDRQMKQILSAEQYQQYLENKAENREKLKESRKNSKP